MNGLMRFAYGKCASECQVKLFEEAFATTPMLRKTKMATEHNGQNIRIEELLQSKRQEIIALAARHGAKRIRVFGSVARGEARPDSDVDFLVDMEPGRSLFDMGGLLMDLQDLLGRKVDVVTEKGLHWYVRDRVLKEAVPL